MGDPGKAFEAVAVEGITNASLIEAAKRRLEFEVDLFGLTDCFDASVAYFGHVLGWDSGAISRGTAFRYRVGGREVAVAASMAKAPPNLHRLRLTKVEVITIGANNHIDVDLHAFAQDLLRRRMREVDEALICP